MNIGGVLQTEIPDTVLRRHLTTAARAASVTIDADAILATVARWIGWYRIESSQGLTPKEAREEAEKLADAARSLREGLLQMSPILRLHVQENIRHLGLPAPDLARLEACIRNAAEQLEPVRTGKRRDESRDNAIRETYRAVLAHTTPPMTKGDARALAAAIVGEAAGVSVPTDKDELRKITG